MSKFKKGDIVIQNIDNDDAEIYEVISLNEGGHTCRARLLKDVYNHSKGGIHSLWLIYDNAKLYPQAKTRLWRIIHDLN